LLRVNALLALGSLAPGTDRDELLAAALAGAHPNEQAAAACAAAMTRNEDWLETLTTLAAAQDIDASVIAAAEAAVKVIQGGGLSLLAKPVREVGQDTIDRKRIFGS
jgi:membrane-bound lytic murein transglycosylase B